MSFKARFLIAVCALMMSVSAMEPTRADTLSDIQQRKKILVGIDLSFPPFGTLDANLKPIGSDVSAAQMLAKDLGVELEIVQLNGPNRVPYLLSSNVDIVISSFTITAERQKVIDFSIPYSVSESSIMAPKNIAITKIEDLANKRVGVVRGNLQDKLLAPILPKDAKVVRFDDDAANVVALLSGQVDAIGGSTELLPSIAKQAPDKGVEKKVSITVLPHGIGIRKGDTALLNWVNDWVKTNLANGKLNASYTASVGFGLPDMNQFMPK